jgi:S-methylmethionine-dependent homocysteine/selenocysteine methylase
MSKYRRSLPQLGGRLFLTDGGIETTLIFHDGLELPYFAAFALLLTPAGTDALRRYFRGYAALAAKHGAGLILESPTWRASADWASKLGYTSDQLADANLTAMSLLEDIRRESETDRTPVVVSGCVGPRGDGYVPDQAMSEADAAQYHRAQIETFAASAADMVCAITMNYTAEAAGIVRAARQAAMPVAISFTVETDGRLPTGQTLKDAIAAVDASTDSYPSYYMINCAHPTHFESVLDAGESSTRRIRGLRANASRMSHAELNEAPALDEGDPVEFGREYAALTGRLGWVNVLGGCCGTDDRHVDQIARACAPLFTA